MTSKFAHRLNAAASIAVPLSALAVAPMLAVGLGVDGRGEFGISQNVLIIASSVLGLGGSDAASAYWSRWGRRTRPTALLLIALGSALLAGAMLPVSTAEGVLQVLLLTLGAAGFGLALVMRGALLARGDILFTGIEKLTTSGTRVVFTLLLLLNDQLSVTTALIALIAPQVIGIVVMIPRVRGYTGILSVDTTPMGLGSAFWLSVFSGLGGVLLVHLDVILLGAYAGTYQVGLYAIPILIAELFTAIAKPFRDGMFAKEANETVLLRRTGGAMLVLAVVGISLTPVLLPRIFGEDFAPAIPASMVMIAAGVFKGASYVAGATLVKKGEMTLRALSTWSALVLGTVALLALGADTAFNASVAKTIAYAWLLATTLLAAVLIRRRTH